MIAGRRAPIALAGGLALLGSIDARAEPAPSGLRIGARTGFSAPIGSTFEGSGALHETIAGQVPLRIDVGYRLTEHLYFGGGLQIGAILSRGCSSDARCSGTDVRAFLLVAYHLFPSFRLDPWAGIGTGFEALDLTRSAFGSTLDLTARGIEVVDAEAGVDLRLGPHLRLGPVLSATVTRFTTVRVNGGTASDFDSVLHGWVALAARAAYDF